MFEEGVKNLKAQLDAGAYSAKELAQASLKAISEKNPEINSVVRTHDEQALRRAEEIDVSRSKGEKLGDLAGIPVLIKDNMAIKDQEVSACSKILQGFKPPYHATAVQKLLDAGAVIVGQANMDEFAMGSSTEYSFFGAAKNPHDTSRVTGGSSGGSAASVAADMVPLSLGSDTGGSIRQPASFCGVVGLKPTYGRVSRYGLFAYGSSLDQIGPLANNVEDAELCYNIIKGEDPLDSTSVCKQDVSCDPETIKGLRIGIPKEFMDTQRGLRPEVASLLERKFRELENAGAVLVNVSLPILDYIIPTYYLIANSEASSNLARYDGVHYGYRSEEAGDLLGIFQKSRSEGFGNEVKNRIFTGTYTLCAGYYDAYYKKADAIRQDMRVKMQEIFKMADVLVGPTAPDVSFKVGEKSDDPLSMYMQDIYTTLANLVYSPAMSVPCGEVDGMPVGMQVIGNCYAEHDVLCVGYAVERSMK